MFSVSRLYSKEAIHALITGAGPWGPALYICIIFSVYVLSPISAVPITFVGFYAFGTHVIFYNSTATLISFFTNFWISRLWGRRFLLDLLGEGPVKKIDGLTKDYGPRMLILLRVFQGGIHDIVSYAAGLTTIPFRTYIVISIFGMIPGALLWYLIADHATTALQFTIDSTLSSAIFSGLFFGGTVVVEFLQRTKKR